MRRVTLALVVLLGVGGVASAEEAALAPSGFEAVDTHGPIFVAPDGALVKRIPEAPAAPGRPRVMTPGGAAPVPAAFTALEVSTDPGLTLWVQTVDLSAVVAVETWLAPGPKATAPAAGASGVWLRPGALVVVRRRVDDVAEVEYTDETMSLSGWIPVASLGKTYRPAPVPAATKLRLPEPADLLDAPEGRTLAVVRQAGPDALVAKLGREQGGQVLVERLGRHVRVVGWIAASSLRTAPASRRMITLFGNAVGDVPVRVHVARGAPVYDRPGGVLLGRFASAQDAYATEERDGYSRIQVQTKIGVIEVWLPRQAPAPTPR